jgi:hypothetical protein
MAVAAPGADAAITRVPRDAAVVAGPTAAGARMVAFDRGRRLCTALLVPGQPRRFAYPDCQRPSFQLRAVGLGAATERRRSYHYGLVRPEVAEAEIVFEDGLTARGPASDGAAYTGRYAGRVRFLLIEARGRASGSDERYVRLFDSSGALLGIANNHFSPPERSRPAKELRRGSFHGVPWALRAFRERTLMPLPGNEERFVDQPCVEVWIRGPGAFRERTLAEACGDADNTREHDSYVFQRYCRSIGYAGVGTVEPEVRRVMAVLGDGRVRRVPLSRLPASYGSGRAFALVLGRNVAIRRLVALKDGGGRELIDRARGPGAARCGEGGGIFFAFGGYEPLTPRGPLAFTVYDDGPLLCATLGRPTGHPGECRHPPLEPYESWILTRRGGARRLVAAIVPGEVARVVVELEGGRRISIDTSTEGFYSGQYHGRVRFFTLELQRRQAMETIRLFDAGGNGLATLPSGDRFRPSGRPRVVLRGAHGLRLTARRFGSRDVTDGALCIRLGKGECSFASVGAVELHADCNPRRLVLWGVLPKEQSAVTVETDRGDLAARVEALPPALRDRPTSGPRYIRRIAAASVFMAVVPARTTPTRLVIGGRRSSQRRLRLPPASAQCGYDDFVFVF